MDFEVDRRFVIYSHDCFVLLVACSDLNVLKHEIDNIDEAEKRIPELVDSQFASLIPAFRLFFML
jgi:hypothetical protein